MTAMMRAWRTLTAEPPPPLRWPTAIASLAQAERAKLRVAAAAAGATLACLAALLLVCRRHAPNK